jgi:hypothetical protein
LVCLVGLIVWFVWLPDCLIDRLSDCSFVVPRQASWAGTNLYDLAWAKPHRSAAAAAAGVAPASGDEFKEETAAHETKEAERSPAGGGFVEARRLVDVPELEFAPYVARVLARIHPDLSLSLPALLVFEDAMQGPF